MLVRNDVNRGTWNSQSSKHGLKGEGMGILLSRALLFGDSESLGKFNRSMHGGSVELPTVGEVADGLPRGSGRQEAATGPTHPGHRGSITEWDRSHPTHSQVLIPIQNAG